MVEPANRAIMHFTHVDNLRSIMSRGALLADNRTMSERIDVVQCADQSIKMARRFKPVHVTPYGVVGDYIPFYYAPRSPVLYKISRGGVRGYTQGQRPLIYLVSSVDTVVRAGLRWVGSDGNCAAGTTCHYNDRELLEEAVDWSVMTAKMWSNTVEDGDRMRRRMAEFLVHRQFPIGCVREVVAKHPDVAERAKGTLGDNLGIRVVTRAAWYY